MIALCIIGQAYVAAIIITAGHVWILCVTLALTPPNNATAPAHPPTTPTPTPPQPQPHKWASDNSHAPVLLWPHDN